jgi:hypothetical protein
MFQSIATFFSGVSFGNWGRWLEEFVGRPSKCMMSSDFFGAIAAENLCQAKVELQETIAEGQPGCKDSGAPQAKPGGGSGQGGIPESGL